MTKKLFSQLVKYRMREEDVGKFLAMSQQDFLKYTGKTLPPGSKRANGKDADRQREYQSAYIALKNGDDSLMAGYKSRYGRNRNLPQGVNPDDTQEDMLGFAIYRVKEDCLCHQR